METAQQLTKLETHKDVLHIQYESYPPLARPFHTWREADRAHMKKLSLLQRKNPKSHRSETRHQCYPEERKMRPYKHHKRTGGVQKTPNSERKNIRFANTLRLGCAKYCAINITLNISDEIASHVTWRDVSPIRQLALKRSPLQY